MTTHKAKLDEIKARHLARQAKIDKAAEDTAAGNQLAALCHGSSPEHDDRGALLEIVEGLEKKHATALGMLTEHYTEQLEKRGLSTAVTAETFAECHAALRQTEEERDQERERAEKAEADLARYLAEEATDLRLATARAEQAESALAAARDKVRGILRYNVFVGALGSSARFEPCIDGPVVDRSEVLSALGIDP